MENINDMMSSGMLTVYFNKYIIAHDPWAGPVAR